MRSLVAAMAAISTLGLASVAAGQQTETGLQIEIQSPVPGFTVNEGEVVVEVEGIASAIGGVRYLELAFKTADTAQLRLVREALLERGHWLQQAPFLAHRLELALPTDHWFSQAYYRIGLGLYDALAGRSGIGSSRLLSARQLHEALPQIRAQSSGGVAYSDGQFDDARLNLLLALTAERAGAVVRTGCRVTALERNSQGRITGALSCSGSGKEERWTARAVVNATGIQADAIRHMADPDLPPRMLTSRGMHLVLEANLCPQGLGLLLPATDDGRVLFMLPFFGRTLVGTTDTPCPLEEAQARARDLLTRLRIPEALWPLSPLTFSGGEQQRVNIARGFAHAYPALLLDEPTASLDAANRGTVLDMIEEAKARGAAILGIFHDIAAREQVCDREVDVSAFTPGVT